MHLGCSSLRIPYASLKFINSIYISIKKIYVIENDLDVYLPHAHPFREIEEFLKWRRAFNEIEEFQRKWRGADGYNEVTCRALILGHECSQSISHYQIVRIHYRPYKSLVLPHEIDISMKKNSKLFN